MFRIDLESGAVLTASGKKSSRQIHFIEAQEQTLELAFVQDNDLYIIPEDAIITLYCDTVEDRNHPMFSANGTVSTDRKSVVFAINTATEEYCQRIHSSNTFCMVDVNIQLPGEKRSRRLARFTALADARLYIDGVAPVQLGEYYTKAETDKLLATATVAGYQHLTTDHCYFHQSYGAVAYLDEHNNLTSLYYIPEEITCHRIVLCSSNSNITGNIVLACGNNRITVPVTAAPQLFVWALPETQSGIIEITRQCSDPADTLKNASGAIVTALIVDWRVA